jgi:NTE family protein
LDPRDQIQAEKDHWKSPPMAIHNILDYANALMGFVNDMANRLHLHQNDWHRTIFVETGTIRTTQFNLSQYQIQMLIANGQQGVQDYFRWFNDPKAKPKPLNRI